MPAAAQHELFLQFGKSLQTRLAPEDFGITEHLLIWSRNVSRWKWLRRYRVTFELSHCSLSLPSWCRSAYKTFLSKRLRGYQVQW
jgi:hypothetical protein